MAQSTTQPAETPVEEPVAEAQATQTAQTESQTESFEEKLASFLGLPVDVIKSLDRSDYDDLVRMLDVMERISKLPDDARKIVAPVAAASLARPKDDIDLMARKIIAYKMLLDSLDGKHKTTEKLLDRLLDIVLKERANPPPTPPPSPPPPPPPTPPQQQSTDLEDLAKKIETLKQLASMFAPQKGPNLDELPNVVDMVMRLNEKLGFKLARTDEAVIEQVKREAYERGLKDGMSRAELLKELLPNAIKTVLELVTAFKAPLPSVPQQQIQQQIQQLSQIRRLPLG